MTAKWMMLAAACVVAASCTATTGAQNKFDVAAAPANETATPASVEGVVLTAIPDAKIPEKKCGMILWTLDGQRPQPVFRYIAEDSGVMALGGVPTALTRTAVGGASGFGVFEQQQFVAANGMNVEIEARFGFGFDSGQYLESGLIRITSPDGWRLVAPAAGIAGCR